MTDVVQPRAWLLMAVGDDRQHAGNSGYDDQIDVYYSWDSTVNNYENIQRGDAIAIWDKRRLLGVSVIEDIEKSPETKAVFRCPNLACRSSSIKRRKTKEPLFRCQSCGNEFNEPGVENVAVTTYRSRHDAAWTPLESLLTGDQLRNLCESPKSQLSMRSLDWSAFRSAVDGHGAESAIERILRRAVDSKSSTSNGGLLDSPQGYARATVRVRRGQQRFREHLLKSFGDSCAFTGPAPDRVLDAGHLYSYAKLGEHHEHGGLLLRRDVHRLFDGGWLAVDPSTLEVDVSSQLEPYEQYARLHGERLQVSLQDQHVEWLGKHWQQFRSSAMDTTGPLHAGAHRESPPHAPLLPPT